MLGQECGIYLFLLDNHELPMKFPREKIFEPTKYLREKNFDPRNTYEEKFRSHKIPARKNFGPKKYPPENISDPRNTHEKKFRPTNARWHHVLRPTRPKMTQDLRNLAHS